MFINSKIWYLIKTALHPLLTRSGFIGISNITSSVKEMCVHDSTTGYTRNDIHNLGCLPHPPHLFLQRQCSNKFIFWNTYTLPQSTRLLVSKHHFTLQAVVWYAYILITHIFKSSKSVCSAVHISCWRHLAKTQFICPTGLHMMWLLSHWVTQDMSWILAASETRMREALVE